MREEGIDTQILYWGQVNDHDVPNGYGLHLYHTDHWFEDFDGNDGAIFNYKVQHGLWLNGKMVQGQKFQFKDGAFLPVNKKERIAIQQGYF